MNINEMLQRNTELLIERICQEIDNIETQFDKLDEVHK